MRVEREGRPRRGGGGGGEERPVHLAAMNLSIGAGDARGSAPVRPSFTDIAVVNDYTGAARRKGDAAGDDLVTQRCEG